MQYATAHSHPCMGRSTNVTGLFVFWWRFIVLSQQLSGAAVVLRWSAYIHLRLVRGQVCGSCNRHRWGVWRAGQARVFRKKTELEVKDE